MALPTNITLNTGALHTMASAPLGPCALFDASGNVSIDGSKTPTFHPDNTATFGSGPVSGPWKWWVSLATFNAGLLGTIYTVNGPAVYDANG